MTGIPEISISVPGERWLVHLPGARTLCRKAVSAALEIGADGVLFDRGGVEVSVVLGDDDFVRALNRTYRGRDAATNVLAFANFAGDDAVNGSASPSRLSAARTKAGEAPVLLGDVVVAFETAATEAAAQGKGLEAHLSHLVVHGVLHLLGYDHEDDTDALRMERIEASVSAQLGLPDPYRLESAPSD